MGWGKSLTCADTGKFTCADTGKFRVKSESLFDEDGVVASWVNDLFDMKGEGRKLNNVHDKHKNFGQFCVTFFLINICFFLAVRNPEIGAGDSETVQSKQPELPPKKSKTSQPAAFKGESVDVSHLYTFQIFSQMSVFISGNIYGKIISSNLPNTNAVPDRGPLYVYS